MDATTGTAGRRPVVVTSPNADQLRTALRARHGFQPDPFQVEAFDVVDRDESVLVAAPTSAGKTLVAEYAIARALASGGTVAYTTPIKALSNQKLNDLVRWVGRERVGLMTGDNVIRPDAPVIVMTTEVLRNMIYAGSDRVDDLSVVILDEVHYLQDPYRGPVWEEVIIQLPSRVQLVCLSATVSNASEVADWIADVRGSCTPVIETTRPVTLHDHFLVAERGSRRLREFRTLRDGRPNEDVSRFLQRAGGGRHGQRRRNGVRPARPRRTEILEYLHDRDRLPAIFFIFSRQGCEDAARQCIEHGAHFLDGRQMRQVEHIVSEHVSGLSPDDLAVLGYEEFVRTLQAGVGAHHAGLVAPFKEAVEDCFAAGLLKAVFATETLALGVNLPAKSVVIESLTRFRGDGHVMLTPGEYTQLTGRAGRRGIDSVGHAYTIWNPYIRFEETAELVASNRFELTSAFRPTYNMAANLIASRSKHDAVALLHQSFAQFRSNRHVVRWSAELEKADAGLAELEEDYRRRYGAPTPVPARRDEVDSTRVNGAVRRLRPGDVIDQPRQHGGETVLVIGTTSRRGGDHRLRVVTARGKTMMLTASDFDRVPQVREQLDLPTPFAPNRRDFQRTAARLLRAHVAESPTVVPARPAGDARYQQSLERKMRSAAARAGALRARVERAENDLGRTLDHIVAVLGALGCAKGWSLQNAGHLLRYVFNERDLVIARAVHDGLFEGLEPPEVAALASTLTYEHRGRFDPPDPWYPSRDVRERAERITGLTERVRSLEAEHALPLTPECDHGFVGAAHGWASGVDLDHVLADLEISAGDFVRNIRLLVDVLRQIADIAPDAATRSNAVAAARAVDRGVVLSSTRLAEHDPIDLDALDADHAHTATAGDPGDDVPATQLPR